MASFGAYATLTPTVHKTTYPAISPSCPSLSQSGKTVLITGGSAGIGYGIARAFASASASRVIILGRREDVVTTAAADINIGGEGVVTGIACDMTDAGAVNALWDRFAAEGVVVDVLVLNAAGFAPSKPLMEVGADKLWDLYDFNFRAQFRMTERFYKQTGKGAWETKYLVHVSSAAIHDFANLGNHYPGYGLTKSAGQLALQLIAQDTPAEKMQIVSYHPGAIFTEPAKDHGFDENSFDWDHVDLPGHFAVWAASPEAKFLHGRFVWAPWDVEQLKKGELRKRIDEDPAFLKIGVNGL